MNKQEGGCNLELNKRLIIGACIEECIHVAGILNFFQVAESVGFNTVFCGPAVRIDDFVGVVRKSDAAIVSISYRLTPEVGKQHLDRFVARMKAEGLPGRRFFLGCLPGLAQHARSMEFFDAIFTGGENIDDALQALKIRSREGEKAKIYPMNLLDRVAFKQPYPIIRAHFGLPSLATTLDGIEALASAGVLDVISIAPDQEAQERLQRPELLKEQLTGAGGVPIRSRADLQSMHERRLRGNYPLLRIYSGTQDLVKNAAMFKETIDNAWAAIPIFWYSELDGRGPSTLVQAIEEHLDAIRWHAERGVPVEVNDPHQWGLRMSSDHIVVADAYISARAAKDLGVKTFVQQVMFNTPPGNTFRMDLARVLAMIEIVQPLVDPSFAVLKETRAGLAYFSPRQEKAMGQLCASTMMQMAVHPHIMHVVSYCEGDHAAEPEDIIMSCNIIDRIVQDAYHGLPDMTLDARVQSRKNELLKDAATTLLGITHLAARLSIKNPFSHPCLLARSVTDGILDAPQLVGSKVARGKVKTRIIHGACVCVDEAGNPITEIDRLASLGFDTLELQDSTIDQIYTRRMIDHDTTT